uniref:Uncharacterized protein AlNc14C9G1126 n=1 Tax=Albugo laibachii Nc14 TaxID=890382 RepID=F0W251_9STRA|nr:conserved hypothetical protein [Albugo laibachii Nc14]|eukprot:CCA15133.1 conserved hypothetical protein [Albugo laibachii Nc14]
MIEMDRATLRRICRETDLYSTPSVNDRLYLHYKGFRCISNLEEYIGLKALWLEGNGLLKIEGLDHQKRLRTLYLHENLIRKIENLDNQTQLDSLHLESNQISKIENLEHMTELTSLTLKGNRLESMDDIAHVLNLPALSILDVQQNRLREPQVLGILARMPSLKVLYLQGNEVVKHIRQYRKTVIYRCRHLTYLDDRPVFPEERRRVDAWGKAWEATGNQEAAQEAERLEMEIIRREKKQQEEMNFRFFQEMFLNGGQKHSGGAQRTEHIHHEEPAPEMDGNCAEDADRVDRNEERRAVLHQCATVGLDANTDCKAFIDRAFHNEQSAPPTSSGTHSRAPPARKIANFFSSDSPVDTERLSLPPVPITCAQIEERTPPQASDAP